MQVTTEAQCNGEFSFIAPHNADLVDNSDKYDKTGLSGVQRRLGYEQRFDKKEITNLGTW